MLLTNERKSLFFQAEDGIRDYKVTGVQTCALPISGDVRDLEPLAAAVEGGRGVLHDLGDDQLAGRDRVRGDQIGRASCRARVSSWVDAVPVEWQSTRE